MNRITTLFAGPSVLFERFDHPEHCVHEDDSQEETKHIAVTFIEDGEFTLRQGNSSWAFVKSDILLSIPGLQRRYQHERLCPDDICLSAAFAPEVVEDALGRVPGKRLLPKISSSPFTRFVYRSVKRAMESEDPLAMESAAFDCIVALTPGFWEGCGSRKGSDAHMRSVRKACDLMLACFNDNLSLSTLGRAVGMSTFHFARCFSAIMGHSPHQYLLRVRLFNAARLLRQGAAVTETATKSGFSNLSHFSRTFHRRFGVSPAKYPSSRNSQDPWIGVPR